MDFDIAIIGGAGRMGRLFAKYFSSKKFSVIASDVVTAKIPGKISWTNSNIKAVKKSKIVLIAVPPEKVVQVFEKIAPHLKNNSTIIEITSIKKRIVAALRKHTGKNSGIERKNKFIYKKLAKRWLF